MTKNTLWSALGVVAAVVIGWLLVNILFSMLAFLFKLFLVAIVAVIVFFVLRSVFARHDEA